MFGISGSEFLVIILVAVVVVGPQRLPEYTRKLTQMVRQLRVFLDNARSQIAEEVGPEMADLDLSSLDPRQYDPRKIVRDALGEDIDAIREDLAHPFRTVGSAAKEISDDAAQAVNDVVKQDRANSLSKQIEAKRAEQSRSRVPNRLSLSIRSSPARRSRWRSRRAWSSQGLIPQWMQPMSPVTTVMPLRCALCLRETSCAPPTPPLEPALRPRGSPSTSDLI